MSGQTNEQKDLTSGSDNQVVAELKDGRLQIVEVEYNDNAEVGESSNGSSSHKYVEVMDSSGKNVLLDLLNMTIVRPQEGEDLFHLVPNDEDGEADTVTCILADDEEEDGEQYIVVEGQDAPMVFLKADNIKNEQPPDHHPLPDNKMDDNYLYEDTQEEDAKPSPTQILNRLKAIQKSKALLMQLSRGRRGRKRLSALPTPQEMLTSPNFKLYLYSCKMCAFKCNAVKELSAHKAKEHAGAVKGDGRWKSGRPASRIALQCGRCPYRAITHAELRTHLTLSHTGSRDEDDESENKVDLSSAEVEAADVLVCGACGYESSNKAHFKDHIVEEHGAVAC
ncbi:uncharacterized protein LOC126971441 [Leptidea sinapis]|uniref:uncharacterized protein LOC126971441 n=1 Tax=Leptidea sinapis TaxID=189913 RepID=UPI002120E64F|nr:uncharacterized protein LOC126971441 [Leptidea sinapis]XP_050673720.1 uncharacterized protein LOC126971441 [Leptidea sinapis]